MTGEYYEHIEFVLIYISSIGPMWPIDQVEQKGNNLGFT